MEHCIDLAIASASQGGGPFTAMVLAADGTLISAAGNRVVADHDPTAHAEVLAIRGACRATGSHQLPPGTQLISSCEPCRLCATAIHLSGICSVFYAASDEDTLTCGFAPNRLRDFYAQAYLESRKIAVQAGILRERAMTPFQVFRGIGTPSYTPNRLQPKVSANE